ncbi:tripartite tricarboxylate transporter TctB family protein [Saccharopolyspora sp. NFXS83]|uniref:tripartite tricarboxylate transporter TctB family protein n=1 Tax=Saccharopolyspora sp. NFXS83 TaxID=2993560 RepID=UPI00224AA53B|nr:tripartite tricarboxylate transporter TctB family protein [Saccharopolyspora sp. NFXS83]MCX2730728.1 tripartite tricarboxylate transporter TctB family protein [Saccharopolyspora sp. NFXS83]
MSSAEADRTSPPRPGMLAAHLFLTALGAAFALGSLAYDWTTEDGTIGAAVMPRVVGVLLVVVGLALVRQELSGAAPADDDAPPVTGAAAPAGKYRMPIVVVTMWAATALVPVLGLLPALVLAMLFLLTVVERIAPLRAVLISAATYVVAHLTFVTLLGAPLPLGLLDPTLWSAL